MKARWRTIVGLMLPPLALVLVSAVARADAEVIVRDAWIRLAPPGASALGGYMTIRNGPRARALVGARSDAFGGVMMHRSVVKDGMAGMDHAASIALAPGASVVFAPGGLHLMLMHPKRPLRLGDRVELELELDDGRRLPVVFEVRK